MKSIRSKKACVLIVTAVCLCAAVMLGGCGSGSSSSSNSSTSAKQPSSSEISKQYYASSCPIDIGGASAVYYTNGGAYCLDGGSLPTGALDVETAVGRNNNVPYNGRNNWSKAKAVVTIYDTDGKVITSYDVSEVNTNSGTTDASWIINGFASDISKSGKHPDSCTTAVYYVELEDGTSWGCSNLMDYSCSSSVLSAHAVTTKEEPVRKLG